MDDIVEEIASSRRLSRWHDSYGVRYEIARALDQYKSMTGIPAWRDEARQYAERAALCRMIEIDLMHGCQIDPLVCLVEF